MLAGSQIYDKKIYSYYSGLNKIDEPRGLLILIKERKWRHTLRHEAKLHYRILEGLIEHKRGRGRHRTTIINKTIKD